ncbi:hypothetical protein ACIA5E_18010 [Nocardia asteroides]|uniref:hypothetical protein n=1 Tax=Nocardia asteroides TaxID=1824 RepID=UPI0037B35238
MTAEDLIAVVESSLTALDAVYRGHADESDLYEAALLAVAVDAARAVNATTLITYDGRSSTTQLRFRKAPGNLWTRNFTYIAVSFEGRRSQLEIHLGVKVVGVSGVAHECDIAILDKQEADWSRSNRMHPRKRHLVAAIEAKNYAASPGLDVGRGFLGLGQELTKENCNLVFPAKGSESITKLIAKKKHGQCFDEATPVSPAAERLRSHLETKIRNWLSTKP